MKKLWDTLKNRTQQMLLQQENEELKWEQKYKKERRLRQEAETETILVKGIGMNSPEMKAANNKIKELEKRIEELTNPVQKARESGL
jgi:polyhydroxyalkanoate synthesis regulator phasin